MEAEDKLTGTEGLHGSVYAVAETSSLPCL